MNWVHWTDNVLSDLQVKFYEHSHIKDRKEGTIISWKEWKESRKMWEVVRDKVVAQSNKK